MQPDRPTRFGRKSSLIQPQKFPPRNLPSSHLLLRSVISSSDALLPTLSSSLLMVAFWWWYFSMGGSDPDRALSRRIHVQLKYAEYGWRGMVAHNLTNFYALSFCGVVSASPAFIFLSMPSISHQSIS